MTFRISADTVLPEEAVTQTFAMLGRRGSGKTSTAVVLAEEFLKGGHAIVWIDPIGVAWGLRSKFKILIAGGEHGDIPLDPGGGKAMAEFLVADRIPTILDVGEFGEGEMKRFVADFASTFYQLNRDPVHLFFDEADEWAPQSGINGDAAKSLGAMQRLVRRGRARGIGCTLISQRSAVLNKSVLTQTECLFAMQTTGPQDLDAIREWIKYHGSAEECTEIISALPRMQQGEAFIYSPGWLKILKRVKIRQRETFDSSRTPKPGEVRSKPKTLAELDLTALSGRIAQSIERAKESDPAELRKRIRALEVQLSGTEGGVDSVVWKRRESDWKQRESELTKEVERFKGAVVVLGAALDQIGLIATGDAVANSKSVKERLASATKLIEQVSRKLKPTHIAMDLANGPDRSVVQQVARDNVKAGFAVGSGAIDGPGQKILNALAWWSTVGNDRPTRGQVAFVAGYSANGGSFKTYLSRLSSAELITSGGGLLFLNDSGRAIARSQPGAKDLAEYHRMILDVVKAEPLVKILNAVIQQGGRELSRNDVGRLTGYEPNGGSFKTYLSRLSSLDLINSRNGQIVPTSLLFPEGLA